MCASGPWNRSRASATAGDKSASAADSATRSRREGMCARKNSPGCREFCFGNDALVAPSGSEFEFSVRLDEAMDLALAEARAALDHGDVPIGAVVVRNADGALLGA